MKRLLSFSVFLMMAMLSFAHSFGRLNADGKAIYYNITSSTNMTVAVTYRGTSYYQYDNEYLGAVTIPATVTYDGKTYSVTSIGDHAFYECSGLTSVTIPNSVTTIGRLAFGNCSGLRSIVVEKGNTTFDSRDNCNAIIETASNTLICGCKTTVIPNSVTSIGECAFYRCSGLTSIEIPNSVTSIGRSAFQSCSGLTSIEIPNSVTTIGSFAFDSCSGLKKVIVPDIAAWCNISFGSSYANPLNCAKHIYSDENTEITDLVIPNSVTSIGECAFDGCSGLTSVTIPNSVTSIGSDAFYRCSGLKKVIVPDIAAWCKISFGGSDANPLNCAKHIYSDANTEITDLVIPNSMTSIGGYAFYGCSGLTSITIPNSVTSIGARAFYKCSGLTSIEIPNSVTSIGYEAFEFCSGLKSVTIPNSVTSIGSSAFSGCSGLTSISIPNSVTSIDSGAFSGCSGLTSISIPNSVTSIGEVAFSNCSGLTSVTIPNSVTSIRRSAFQGCSGLTKVIVPDIAAWCKISFYDSYGNPLYYAKHIYSDENTEITDLVIPNGVTSIGDYAFSNCSGLTSVTIGNSVTSIGDYAFYNCSSLTSVIIPNSVTNIGTDAFSGTAWYTAWYNNQPEGLIYLGKVAYKYKGTMPANTVIDLEEGTTGIADNAFYNCSGLTSITIPNSVTSIGNYAFRYCSGLKSVTIGNSVTSIGYYAFDGCSGLTSVTIPNSVTSIGTGAFSGCSSLASITIPNSVTSIGKYAFYGCSGLTKVIVPDIAAWCKISFESYDANPLYCAKHIYSDENTEITDLVIPNGVTSIGDYAFYNCSGLTSVTIPNSVTSIGNYAFSNCSGLSSFTLPDNITSLYDNSFPSWTKLYVNIGTKTLLELWSMGYSNIYNKETKQKITKPTLSASATQATLKVFINEKLDCYEYSCDGEIITDNFFEKKGLRPGGEECISVEISLGDFSRSISKNFSTKGLNPVVKGDASASSINATGSYDTGDAKIVKHELSCNGKKVDGINTSFCGLKPNTSYKVVYTITVAYGKNDEFTTTYTAEDEIKTSELKMTTEQPKVVSVGNVIVSAKANVDDAETNVGFEWRRTDWTDDFKSNTGTAYMYEGTMEGYIRNLNAEKLWKFRPYYLADDGKYYYGDWMGLDPTNTSYFEPTVHTYANINIEGNTALVKGYALGGTDKITVQGFKYWKAANLAPSGDLALEARKASPVIPANAETIEAEGRVMEATLSGLDYECTYSYVAFAKTDEGTFYGEVKTFTTGPNTTGIEVVRDADSETKAVDDKVKGIYTLTGVKLSDDAAELKTMKRGIYIVNGRKVAVK